MCQVFQHECALQQKKWCWQTFCLETFIDWSVNQ